MKVKRKALRYNASIKVRQVRTLPSEGTWLPVSIVAYLSRYTLTNVERLYKNKVVDSIKFPKGPILVNYDDLISKWLRG